MLSSSPTFHSPIQLPPSPSLSPSEIRGAAIPSAAQTSSTSPPFVGPTVSLIKPGHRDGTIQCFIKRDKSNLTYHLYLCLSPALLVENGKFLLSARRSRRTSCTEYIISTGAHSISRSSNTYIGKMRSNFLGTKFIIYDTQPHNTSRRFHSKKVSPKPDAPSGSSYSVAQITYELNVLGTRGPRRMHCTMHSIPASALDAGGSVPGQPDRLFQPEPEPEPSFSFSKSLRDLGFSSSRRVESCRFSDIAGGSSSRFSREEEEGEGEDRALVLKNKVPRWHEQLQCWCLNFRGRVTVASVKNFQLVVAVQPGAGAPTPAQPAPPEHDKIILQFGKVAKDMFTMDYRYPLSAFQAFAICLTSFDTKLACE